MYVSRIKFYKKLIKLIFLPFLTGCSTKVYAHNFLFGIVLQMSFRSVSIQKKSFSSAIRAADKKLVSELIVRKVCNF